MSSLHCALSSFLKRPFSACGGIVVLYPLSELEGSLTIVSDLGAVRRAIPDRRRIRRREIPNNQESAKSQSFLFLFLSFSLSSLLPSARFAIDTRKETRVLFVSLEAQQRKHQPDPVYYHHKYPGKMILRIPYVPETLGGDGGGSSSVDGEVTTSLDGGDREEGGLGECGQGAGGTGDLF